MNTPTNPTRTAIALLTLILTLVTTGSLEAQRRGARTPVSTSPEAMVKELAEKRTPASQAAQLLVREHRQTHDEAIKLLATAYSARATAGAAVEGLRMAPDAAARALKGAGIEALVVTEALTRSRTSMRAIAGALRGSGYSAREATSAFSTLPRSEALRVYTTLKDAGFGVTELSRAIEETGMPVDLDCVGPDGMPSPCGNFGNGEVNEPAMGQVQWSPQDQGEATTEVVFESTNIPPVDVLFDGSELEVLEMTSSRVRVRLPGQTGTGPLAFRRRDDGVIGVIEPNFTVVPFDPVNHIDWSGAASAALEGALKDADLWIASSRIEESKCTVTAVNALATPGVLSGPSAPGGNVRTELLQAGLPDEVAAAWQEVFEEALLAWADHVMIPGLPFYPAFAAFPAAEAPPIPNVPFPLGTLISPGSSSMTPPVLAQALRNGLPGGDTPDRGQQIDAFATDLGASWALFLTTAQVMNVVGKGPIPAFAPPAIPVGPVVSGSCFTPGMWLTVFPSGAAATLPDLSYMLDELQRLKGGG